MGKIWLKSVDPSRRCCGCEGKAGPCSSCTACLVTGNFENVIKDVYNGLSYGTIYSSLACPNAGYLAGFTTPTGLSTGSITRSYSAKFSSPKNYWSNWTFDVFEQRKVAVVGTAYSLDLDANYAIDVGYTLVSSAASGLRFASTSNVLDVYDHRCNQKETKTTQLSYLNQINLYAQSGDTYTLSAKGYGFQRCSHGVIANPYGYLGPAPFYYIDGCSDVQIDLNAALTRKEITNPPVNPWLEYNGAQLDGSSQLLRANIFFESGHTAEPTPMSREQANSWCGSNTHLPPGKSSYCTTDGTRVCVVYNESQSACCTNQTVDQLFPRYVTRDGSMQFTFLSNECVTLTLGTYIEIGLQATNARGVAIDPMTRMVNLNINTGFYTVCNALP